MTLPVSGAISLFDIRDEFGGSNPVSLFDYYRGGGIVPDIPTNSGIPTSGPISILDFYGATNQIIQLTGDSVVTNFFGAQEAVARIEFQVNGNYIPLEMGSGGDWAIPNVVGIGSNYEIRLDVNSGDIGSPQADPIGQWLTLAQNRVWSAVQSNPGTSAASATVRIRDATTHTVIDTGIYNLEANNLS